MTIELRYGRGTVPVAPPPGGVPTVIAKRAMPVRPDPRRAVGRHPDLRHHPPGAERPLPRPADPRAARRGGPARRHHGAGRDRPALGQRGRRARRAGGRPLGARDLIVASACSEGMGSKHYGDAQRRLVDLGPDGFAASIEKKTHADIDEWQTQMQLRPMRVGRVRLYTDGLDSIAAGRTGVERVGDLTGAGAESMARHRDPHVAFVPEGPYVVPVRREA